MKIRRIFASLGFFSVSLAVCGFAAPGPAQDRAVVLPASPNEAYQQKGVFLFLQEYFSALAVGDVGKLALYHPSLTPQQLDVLRDYFAHTIRDLHIRLQDVRVQTVANTATVAFSRTDRFIDRPTSRPVEKSIRLATTLVQGGNGWRVAGLDQVASALMGDNTATE